VLPNTLLVDPSEVEAKITSRTKAIVAVDYAGQPGDYDRLRAIADEHRLILIADACHSLGALYRGRKVGTLADLTVFSFHPVKHITTGEGGMIVTERHEYADKMRRFRNHGISTDHRQRSKDATWFYEMTDLGYNYRLTDFQCVLGLSQLQKLSGWIERRREIAREYNIAFGTWPGISPLDSSTDIKHAYHLYVVKLEGAQSERGRAAVFDALRKEGIGVNVHYIPAHLHPFYQERFGGRSGICPVAEEAYERILSLPIYPTMEDRDVRKVVETVWRVVGR
jgi:perosamine synthetase